MVNVEVIKQRLDKLSGALKKIERYKEISLEDFYRMILYRMW